MSQNKSTEKICIIGLGYVGIPLAISFAKKKFIVNGFDIDKKKIDDLKNGIDPTNEAKKYGIKNLKKVEFTSNPKNIKDSNIYIITVPTPVDKNKRRIEISHPGASYLKRLLELQQVFKTILWIYSEGPRGCHH